MSAPPPRAWLCVAALLAALVGVSGVGAAQEPSARRAPPADTVAGDTARAAARADSAAPDTAPPRRLVRFPEGEPPGWAAGVWVWERADLLASGALTLTELLERVPGVVAVRASGVFGLPEGVGVLGANAGRAEVVLDGYVLDPLAGAGVDLSRIELASLERVRVVRRLGGLRVELETLRPADRRAYSRVEAGAGDYDTSMLRAVFLAPRVVAGPFGVGIERVETEGFGFVEPAQASSLWLAWGAVAGRYGAELELRRGSIRREERAPVPLEGSRQDLLVRMRGAPLAGLALETFAGRSSLAEDVFVEDTARLREHSDQVGLRARYAAPWLWAGTALRWRSHPGLARLEGEFEGAARVGRLVAVAGAVSVQDWRGATATWYTLRAEAGQVLDLRPVVEWTTGRRGIPFLADTAGAPAFSDRRGLRAGVELARGRLHLAGSLLSVEADSVAGLGLAFDSLVDLGLARSAGRLYPGGRARGWEVSGRLPLPWRPLAVEGWAVSWSDAPRWPYLPERAWRAALVLHALPLRSGNLELVARLEANHRGAMAVPAPGAPDSAAAELAFVAPRTTLDAYLQLRILDVRAFVRWENLTNRPDLADLPGRTLPGQRVFYGVKWQFWN